MKNNIDLDTSFNPIEVSIQKVLSEPKTALIHFEGNVPANHGCMVCKINVNRVVAKILQKKLFVCLAEVCLEKLISCYIWFTCNEE